MSARPVSVPPRSTASASPHARSVHAQAANPLSRVPRTYASASAARRTLVITGLFNDRITAERAYQSVTERGYVPSEINLVMSNAARTRHFSASGVEDAARGPSDPSPAPGASSEHPASAIAASTAVIGRTVFLPGLSLLVAGPLAVALGGASGSTARSGLATTLSSWNLPDMRVKAYEAALKEGKILMAVIPRTVADANHFDQAWKKDDADLWGRASA